jgi:hypothetical protein
MLQTACNMAQKRQNVAETFWPLKVSATNGRFATLLQHFCNIFATFTND